MEPSPSGAEVGRINGRGARGKAHPNPSPEGEGLASIQGSVILPSKGMSRYWHFAALRPLAIWPFIAADSLAP